MKATQFILYKIHWPGAGFFYYGKTRGFRKRRNRHLRELRDGSHHNCKLLFIYAIHGVPEITIVKYCCCDEALDALEKRTITKHSKNKKCCNIYGK